MKEASHSLSEFFYDKYVREATRLILEHNHQIAPLAQRESPFCKAGCTACCGSVFFVTQCEIDAVAHWLLAHPDELTAFCARVTERIRRIKPYAELLKRCAETGEAGSMAAKEFLALQIPCAFLNQDNGLCTIYEVRPLVCAAYVSIVPSRFCATDPRASVSKKMSEVHSKTKLELQKLLKKNRINVVPQLDISASVVTRLEKLRMIRIDDTGTVTTSK